MASQNTFPLCEKAAPETWPFADKYSTDKAWGQVVSYRTFSMVFWPNTKVVENMHTSDDGEVFSDENIDNKVERECIRVRLLQMLDLSFIEGFVCSPSATSSSSPTGRSNVTQICKSAQLRHFHTLYQSRKRSKLDTKANYRSCFQPTKARILG